MLKSPGILVKLCFRMEVMVIIQTSISETSTRTVGKYTWPFGEGTEQEFELESSPFYSHLSNLMCASTYFSCYSTIVPFTHPFLLSFFLPFLLPSSHRPSLRFLLLFFPSAHASIHPSIIPFIDLWSPN